MTDCNRDPLHFSRLGPKAVVADFRGGRLTTDAGALLLREVADRLGLFDALDAAIPDPRDPVLIVHDQKALLAQRIIAIALGYEDLNDHQTLRADPALQLAAGRPPEPDATLASPADPLPPGEPRRPRRRWSASPSVLVDQFIAAHADAARAPDPRLRRHRRPRPRPAGGPLLPRLLRPSLLPAAVRLLRRRAARRPTCGPANIDAAKHARAVLKLLVRRLRAAWPEVKITIRADSGFCRWRLMRWCDSHGIGYVLGLARNPALERPARDEIARAERQFRRDRPAAAALRLVRLRGGELGPAAAGDRQGRAHRPGGQPAVRRGQRAGRPAGVI